MASRTLCSLGLMLCLVGCRSERTLEHGVEPEDQRSSTEAAAPPTKAAVPEPVPERLEERTEFGFALQASLWEIPESDRDTVFAATYGANWMLLDIDGDGLFDFIWTGKTAYTGAGLVAKPWEPGTNQHWLVYFNTKSGFAPTPIRYSLPQFFGRDLAFADVNPMTVAYLDIDGDNLVDLVSTGRPKSYSTVPVAEVWGFPDRPHWKVFKNNHHGFDEDPIEWPVPQMGVAGDNFGSTLSDGWATLDLDGDKRVDLVWQGVWNAARTDFDVFGGDVPQWKFFKNTGEGFALEATAWSLPNGVPGEPDPGADVTWSLLDLDGDGLVDLVNSGRLSQAYYGDLPTLTVFGHGDEPWWDVYLNKGDRFEARATRWRVPAGPLATGYGLAQSDALWRLGLSTTYNGGPAWRTFDIDGDALPDLVDYGNWVPEATRLACWGHPDAPTWRIYRNLGGRFAESPEEWRVPALSYSSQLVGTWAIEDLDGDHRIDLVSTGEWTASRSGAVVDVWRGDGERPFWKVFLSKAPN